MDKDLHPWNGAAPASWDHHVDTPICPVSAGGAGDSIEALSLRNGQSCYYFSHGCTIHCDRCDGKTARFGSTCGNEKTGTTSGKMDEIAQHPLPDQQSTPCKPPDL